MTIDIIPLSIDKAVKITLKNKVGLEVVLTNFGAGIVSIASPDRSGKTETITLTYDDLNEYYLSSHYFGKTIGRTAGRIPDSLLKINHESYALESSFGRHTLHGGRQSLAFKLFQFKLAEFGKRTSVQFRYISPFGEGGYPGQVSFLVTYHIEDEDAKVTIEYEAKTDFPTPVNMTNHTYFNLSGDVKRSVGDHVLTMNTPLFYEVDEELLLKQKRPVTKTMDFRRPKAIGADIEDRFLQDSKAFGYDHTFKTNGENVHITLTDPVSGRRLTIESDYPSVNIYTDNYPSDKKLIGGKTDFRYAGIAIEPQFVPTEIDTYILEPETTYRHYIALNFGRDE